MKNKFIEIPLTRGYVALVDDQDSDLGLHKWCVNIYKRRRNIYAERKVAKDKVVKSIKLHIVIMERILGHSVEKGYEVDHVNNNGLDNRRENLRLATRSQNLQNTKLRKDNTSGYKGICYHKDRRVKRWQAIICKEGKRISLKYHETPELAYEAYKKAARELFGDFACIE